MLYIAAIKNWGSINRNILECKAGCPGTNFPFEESINRNILECKVVLQEEKDKDLLGINRNILECKVDTLKAIFGGTFMY